ncbi:Lysine-specific demethylase 3B, partial [Tilletia horrida]
MRASHGQKRKRPGGDDGASHSMERVVVDAYLHERVDADGDVCGKLLRLKGWPRTVTTVYLTARCAYSLALELTPIIQTELNHAANRRMQPLLRSGGVAALQRCTQCSVYVCGSWQCVACGAELCLSCFRLVCETPAVTLASYATADHLISCKQAKDELYYAHKAEDFVPVARLTVAELSMHRAFARTVTQAYRQSALDGQDEMAADIAEWRRVDRPWGKRMRQREDAGVNITKNKVTVLRAGSECDIDERSQAVLLSLLALGEPLVIQQDLVAPLDDDELSRLFDPRTPIPVRAMMDNDPSMTMQEGEWPWEKVAAALCGVGTEDIRYLDTRDFPADGQLRDISPGAADAFLRASSFPDDPTSGNTGIKSECTRVFERLSDMSAWIAPIVTARNGKDLCYAALGAEDDEDADTTSLHVDEAGAVNVLLWAKTTPIGTAAGTEAGTKPACNLWTLGDEKACNPATPIHEEEMDARPVGAEWLFWPPKARAFFAGAALACAISNPDLGECSGDVLFGQRYTATNAFIEKVVELGGEECRAWRVKQRVGEAVVVPPGWPHQVRNLVPCFKIARDIMPTTHAREIIKVQRER